MARKAKGKATGKSRRWLQVLVNERRELIDPTLLRFLAAPIGATLEWLSPLASDDYAEYSDAEFIQRLRCNLKMPLSQFWPRGGPEWDALARTSDDRLILVEAKAHIPEIVSSPTGATEPSLSLIRQSLAATKAFIGSRAPCDWTTFFYQYTNRLAHLYFLRELNALQAFLVSIYFTHAPDVQDAPSEAEWQGALKLLHTYVGVGQNRLSPYIIDVFIDTRSLASAA